MKRNNFQVLTTVFGILLAIAVVCSNVAFSDGNSALKEKVKTEKGETSQSEYSFVSAPTITPPASANIECSLLAHCIFEIDQQQDENSGQATTVTLNPQKLLITLFRVIISPNAP
jgi:hypothetical protein